MRESSTFYKSLKLIQKYSLCFKKKHVYFNVSRCFELSEARAYTTAYVHVLSYVPDFVIGSQWYLHVYRHFKVGSTGDRTNGSRYHKCHDLPVQTRIQKNCQRESKFDNVFFFVVDEWLEDRNSKYHYKRAIIDPQVSLEC